MSIKKLLEQLCDLDNSKNNLCRTSNSIFKTQLLKLKLNFFNGKHFKNNEDNNIKYF
jgi:hypothetical protein